MEVLDVGKAIPSYRMLELAVFDENIVYVFMRNAKRFYINIRAETLEGQGALLSDFKKFRDGIDDPDTLFQFEDWVLDALDDFMCRAAPTPAPGSRKSLTLLEYFSAPTFAFQVVNQDEKLFPIQEEYDPELHGRLGPRTQIVNSLPNPDKRCRSSSTCSSHTIRPHWGEHVILRSALPNVPLIPASDLERVDDGLHDEESSDIPKKVRHIKTGEVFFFKPGFRDHGHLRELDILSKIDRSGQFQPPFLTSRLVGLVVWGANDHSLMGFLEGYIEGDTLSWRMEEASLATKTKWFHQIEATMKQLHQTGIVWGDAKLDSVIINPAGDAVVVDFGGGYTPEYIEPELQQTIQGDLMTLEKMAAELGII
ncbi:hypothetical protein F4804DRAFT_304202 [Jackrogersella minutella]|nr:hypothetical protein F4804DRAFT_304202 [Jackrogersella minutella]